MNPLPPRAPTSYSLGAFFPAVAVLVMMTIVVGCAGTAAVPDPVSDCGDPDRDLRVLALAEPDYPARARAEGREAAVKVSAWVAPDGTVGEAHVLESTGDVLFDEAALTAALASRFEPAVKDCRPIGSWAVWTYDFKPVASDSVEPREEP